MTLFSWHQLQGPHPCTLMQQQCHPASQCSPRTQSWAVWWKGYGPGHPFPHLALVVFLFGPIGGSPNHHWRWPQPSETTLLLLWFPPLQGSHQKDNSHNNSKDWAASSRADDFHIVVFKSKAAEWMNTSYSSGHYRGPVQCFECTAVLFLAQFVPILLVNEEKTRWRRQWMLEILFIGCIFFIWRDWGSNLQIAMKHN